VTKASRFGNLVMVYECSTAKREYFVEVLFGALHAGKHRLCEADNKLLEDGNPWHVNFQLAQHVVHVEYAAKVTAFVK
jgi:hypothetical protein